MSRPGLGLKMLPQTNQQAKWERKGDRSREEEKGEKAKDMKRTSEASSSSSSHMRPGNSCLCRRGERRGVVLL